MDLSKDKSHQSLQEKEKLVSRKYKSAIRELTAVEKELNALLEIKQSTNTHVISPYRSTLKSEATVVLLATDWHVAEEVKASKVGGLNRYNLEIAKKRADQFFQRAVKLTKKEQQDIPIQEMVLFLGGDFITGNIHEELASICSLLPVDETMYAQSLIESGINFLLAHTKLRITIVCSCGNHSRITKKTHISTEQGNSLEWFMYHSLRGRFASEPRIKFVIEDGYHTYLDIYGWTCRFHHGHNIRYGGGVGGLTIPMNKAISQWNKARKAHFDFVGHWHTYMPMSNFVINGSLIGYNAFGISIKADFERPQQAMFLVDKIRGRTVHMPILFDI